MQNAITSNCLSEKKKKLSGRDDSRLYCSYRRGGSGFLLSCTVCLAMDFLNRICRFSILASLDTNMTDMHQTTWDCLHLFYIYIFFPQEMISYCSAFIKTGPCVQMLYCMHALLWFCSYCIRWIYISRKLCMHFMFVLQLLLLIRIYLYLIFLQF